MQSNSQYGVRVGFDAVDESSDSQQYVRYLMEAQKDKAAQSVKQLSYSLLGAKPGMKILDCGCGIGDDVRELAKIVGAKGCVVGVDASNTMIRAAQERSEGLEHPGEFKIDDLAKLSFDPRTFDCCRAERVLQHMDDPVIGLNEMVRVLRPNGIVAITETEYDSMITRLTNPDLSRRMTMSFLESVRNPYIVRQLPGLFRQLGMRDMRMVPHVNVATECSSFAIDRMWLREDYFTATEIQEIKADLKQLVEKGQYFHMVVSFTIAGRKEA